jgi:hypothetical protein
MKWMMFWRWFVSNTNPQYKKVAPVQARWAATTRRGNIYFERIER